MRAQLAVLSLLILNSCFFVATGASLDSDAQLIAPRDLGSWSVRTTGSHEEPDRFAFAEPASLGTSVLVCVLCGVNTLLFFPGVVLLWRRRHLRVMMHRSVPTLLMFLGYFYVLSVIQTASILHGKPVFCDLVEAMMVALPFFIQHFLLMTPTIVLQADLVQYKLYHSAAEEKRDAYWCGHHFVRPKFRLAFTFTAEVLHIGLYLGLRYLAVLPGGDCNRTSITAFIIHLNAFLVALLYFVWRLRSIRDPFYMWLELVLTIVAHIPAVYILTMIYVISPQLIPDSLDFRWIFMQTSIWMSVINLWFPLILSYPRVSAWLHKRTASKDAISPEDAKDTDTSSTIFALSQGVNVFQAVLNNPILLEEFTLFTAKEWSVENVVFYKAVEDFKSTFRATPQQAFEKAKFIYQRFIKSDARVEVNLDARMKKTISDMIQREILSESMFDEAQRCVVEMMETDSFPKWQRTNGFKLALEKALKEKSSTGSITSSSLPKRGASGEEKSRNRMSVVELIEVA